VQALPLSALDATAGRQLLLPAVDESRHAFRRHRPWRNEGDRSSIRIWHQRTVSTLKAQRGPLPGVCLVPVLTGQNRPVSVVAVRDRADQRFPQERLSVGSLRLRWMSRK
jgi:hypothetical protein